MKIQLEYLNVKFVLAKEKVIRKSLEFLVREEKCIPGTIIIVFVDKKEILRINKSFLKHNYITDVISFPIVMKGNISGEIYICVEKVRENAGIYSEKNFDKEIKRVIIHGVLHLIGYKDKEIEEKKVMKNKEDMYLAKYFNI